jgi:hypothetical protein
LNQRLVDIRHQGIPFSQWLISNVYSSLRHGFIMVDIGLQRALVTLLYSLYQRLFGLAILAHSQVDPLL